MKSKNKYWSGLGSLFLLSFLGFLPFIIVQTTHQNWLNDVLNKASHSGFLIFWIMASCVIAFGFSRQVICFSAGYLYGIYNGFLTALFVSVTGCIIAFSLARFFGGYVLKKQPMNKFYKFNQLLQNHPLSTTIMIRFLPIGSNLFTNIIAGLSRIHPLPFILGSGLGYCPQTLIFVLLGSGIRLVAFWQISISLFLFFISGFMATWLYRKRNQTSDSHRQE
jgi:uncharacterized membrane protein YdjX (TVP38/TMEM64 family)